MEQMYLVEILIDKVTIFATDGEENSHNKKLITKVKFGPKVEFIIKEGQLVVTKDKIDDIVETNDAGRKQWTRIIRVGKSYLFPSHPDTLMMTLSKFPLEIEVWNDDDNENPIFVGVGNMVWDTHFFRMLKETSDICKIHEPLAIKSVTTLWAECCCKAAGEIIFILRLSALGNSIITEFQQQMDDPNYFVFRTNKAPSMFQCKRVEGDDPNFNMVGSLYETTTLEDPDVSNAQKKIEVCTELQSCGAKDEKYVCEHHAETSADTKKKYPIEKIRMGDITGPCGNTNCVLAHKVRTYIRKLESYKGKTGGGILEKKPVESRKVCGTCGCKDDRWHREDCPELKEPKDKVKCGGCGGMTKKGDTCKNRKEKLFGTGVTPKGSQTQVTCVFDVPTFKDAVFGQNYTVENCYSTSYLNYPGVTNKVTSCQNVKQTLSACYSSYSKSPETQGFRGINNPMVYNVETNERIEDRKGRPLCSIGTSTFQSDFTNNIQVYNCMEISEDKDCKCSPTKPSPPCRTFDCDCISETLNIASRKHHKPYCPLYKHKENCPVNMKHEEEDLNKAEEDEDAVTPLPYGLPPVQLGPCPILGRPCSVPDGFARMYKNAVQPTLPPSYSKAGKVCCSKEFERIKKAIQEYMKYEKDHDFRCINKFNVDTERRCCDKEQILLSLMGKGCCGTHKLSIQEKYKEKPS